MRRKTDNIIDELIGNLEEVKDYVIKEGTQETTEGNWIFHINNLPLNIDERNKDRYEYKAIILATLEEMLNQTEEVSDVIIDIEEGSLDVNYYLDYCRNFEDEYELDEGENNSMRINAQDATFDLAEIDGIMVLFTNQRIYRDSVPQDLNCYDIRETDGGSGVAGSVEKYVMLNYWGTILSANEFPLVNGYYELKNDDMDYCGSMEIDEYRTIDHGELMETPEDGMSGI